MPRGDKTGPDGRGPNTGRGAGGCTTTKPAARPRAGRGTRVGGKKNPKKV